MGNSVSANTNQTDTWWPPPNTETTLTQTNSKCTKLETNETKITPKTSEVCENTEDEYEVARRKHREQKIKEFRSEWEKKHIVRREAIAERSREIVFLREELEKYKKENEQLKDLLKQNDTNDEQIEHLEDVKYELEKVRTENDILQKKISQLNEDLNKFDELTKQNLDLRKSIAETQKDLQAVNVQVLEFENERRDYETHVIALKDVIKVSKSLLEIRENQLRELQTKVAEIETSLAEREVSMMSTDLKDEYERQLENIRSLRALYEQRQAATKAERDLMASQLTDAKNNLENEQKKIGEMEERVNELDENVSDKYDQIKNLESLLGLAKAEYRGLQAEMAVINQLFSQILFGFSNCPEIDFDKLIKLLEENHDVLTNIASNEESETLSSALPKTLLDLVNRVAEENKNSEACSLNDTESDSIESISNESPITSTLEDNVHTDQQQSNQINSAEQIVNKLPKVWRVLIELLRQQCGKQPVEIQEDGEGEDPCYKSVETPKGPKMVLSVSKTFIRLKDLILEKKSLEKEMSRLKHLNTHLEGRLQDQEKRLETVSSELSKTWHVVGRMQRQHQQLHTHEKILRYELGQKRKMLTELKQELEYCREKWEQAREKNSSTEEEWKKLRMEFAARKTAVTDDLSNSAESGYSDEQEGSSDEEAEKQNKIKTDPDEVKSDIIKMESASVTPTTTETRSINNSCQGGECSNSKTEVEVQNVIRKTQPASLDMIDDVCALAISPVVIVNDVFTSQFSEAIQTTSNQVDVEVEPIETNEVKTEHINEEVLTDNLNAKESTSTSTPAEEFEEISSTSLSSRLAATSTILTNLTQDERLQRREERLQRLEEQCKQLVKKVSNTNSRSTQIHNRLDALHEQYGNDPPRSNVSEETEENQSTESNQTNDSHEPTTNNDNALTTNENNATSNDDNLTTRNVDNQTTNVDNETTRNIDNETTNDDNATTNVDNEENVITTNNDNNETATNDDTSK